MKKNITYLEEQNEFCWSFQNKMKLPTGHSTWTVYIFFFNFVSIFSIDRECYNKEKSVPIPPTLGKYETLLFLFFFFSFSISSVLYNVSKKGCRSIKFHHIKSEKNSFHRKYFRTWNVPITTHLIKNHLRYNFMKWPLKLFHHWSLHQTLLITTHLIKNHLSILMKRLMKWFHQILLIAT